MTRPTGPVPDLIRHLDGQTLREYAALADALNPRLFTDPERAADELAEMAATGRKPTAGWWRRHLQPKSPESQQKGNTMTVTTQTGNLTRDPELRYSAKGSAWCVTALAVNRRTKGDDGVWADLPPEFFDVVAFGQLAESVAECLAKGDRVIVVGRLESETWTGRDGKERTTDKIVADEVGPSLRHGTVQVDRVARTGHTSDALARAEAAESAEDLFGRVGT
jgi:single-strand DNA-binding protein